MSDSISKKRGVKPGTKRGAYKAGGRKNTFIHVRASEVEIARVDATAEIEGLTRSNFVRSRIGLDIKTRDTTNS